MGESGAPESLDRLLSGLDGVEGSIMSRPKSLKTMKRTDMKNGSNVPKPSRSSPETDQSQLPAGAAQQKKWQEPAAGVEDMMHHQIDDLDWSQLEMGDVKNDSNSDRYVGFEMRQLLWQELMCSACHCSGVDVFSRFEDINLNEKSKAENPFGIGVDSMDEQEPCSGSHEYVELHDDPFLSLDAREAMLTGENDIVKDPLDIFGGTPSREIEQVTHESIPSESDVASSTHEYRELETEHIPNHSRGNSLPVFEHLEKRSMRDDVQPSVAASKQPESSSHHHNAGEAMADIGHKAAKALQIGKKWLFNTSKNIARDVQSRIDARASRKKHSRQRSIIDTPMSDFMAEEHHVQWAKQLMSVTPEDRMAALAAMDEFDRMAVQQIIDEMIWEESHVQNEEPAPPPPYDDVVGDHSRNSESVTKVPEESSFDLLDLDGKSTRVDTQWEDDLFGSHKPTPNEQDDIDIFQETGAPRINISQSTFAPSGDIDQGKEPEIRRKLREQRMAREQERIAQQVAAARDKEEKDASEKEERVMIRERLRPEIDEWCAGKKDNIRSLLCTMDKVMWEGSGWKSPSVVDIMEAARVRKWYMKANLVVHPDKVKQKNGSLEQLTRAEMIFDVLKHAWGMFQA